MSSSAIQTNIAIGVFAGVVLSTSNQVSALRTLLTDGVPARAQQGPNLATVALSPAEAAAAIGANPEQIADILAKGAAFIAALNPAVS